ncbi:unnamed protein product [Hermetia illucens]|uniref:Uncharacterized protein n=1 Tax=Hermetia illucens TaxID=343691 RepID=A0A7R8Z161_HERIL|nr:unnamed protein product [Hermetia illucens]
MGQAAQDEFEQGLDDNKRPFTQEEVLFVERRQFQKTRNGFTEGVVAQSWWWANEFKLRLNFPKVISCQNLEIRVWQEMTKERQYNAGQ